MSKWLSTLDEAFDDLWSYRPLAMMGWMNSVPALNLVEKNDQYLATLSIPGIETHKVKLRAENHTVSVVYSDEETKVKKNGEGKVLRQEYTSQSFSRSFTLPMDADVKNMKASYKNGVLSLHIPKVEGATQGQDIPIEIQ